MEYQASQSDVGKVGEISATTSLAIAAHECQTFSPANQRRLRQAFYTESSLNAAIIFRMFNY